MKNSYMESEFKFMGVRLINGHISPAEWTVKAAYSFREAVSEVEKIGSSFCKFEYFGIHVLPNSLFISMDDMDSVELLTYADNNIIMLSEAPTDDCISRVLYNKLDSILGKFVKLEYVTISSSAKYPKYTYVGDLNILPATTKEYLPDYTSMHRKPWWDRNDGFTYEFIKPVGAPGKIKDAYADVVDPFDDLEPQVSKPETKLAKVIKVDKWKPVKV